VLAAEWPEFGIIARIDISYLTDSRSGCQNFKEKTNPSGSEKKPFQGEKKEMNSRPSMLARLAMATRRGSYPVRDGREGNDAL